MSGSTITAVQDDSPGFFGKVPEVGDFVSRRLPQDFIRPWDLWLQSAISCSREQLGQEWLEVYLTSPIWRFALSAGVAGPDAWAGVLMPSVDRVGRYFPFTVAYRLSKGVNLFALTRAEQTWFESAEALALSVLDDDTPTLAMLDAGVVALGIPCAGITSASVSGRGLGWWLPSPSDLGYADVLDRFLPRLAEQQFDASSIWWSTGSHCVGTGIALCKGLPDTKGFAAMLAGSWQSYGWADLSPDLPRAVENDHKTVACQAVNERSMTWSSASRSHVGIVREVNEDACLDLPDAGVWLVADGVGGHKDGALASRLIVDALAQVGRHSRLSRLVDDVEDRLRDVHTQLVKIAGENSVVGSTVAALVLMQQYSVCLWVGDSRVYRFREGRLERLTQDHSYVEELVKCGKLTREEAERHPDSNVITRAVGAGEELYLDARLEEVRPADLYLICSDGLYREVCEQEIAEQMLSADCHQICDRLVNLALDRGAQDNVTVVLIAINDKDSTT